VGDGEVKIYLLMRGIDYWLWLCPDHLKERESQKWERKQTVQPKHKLECDDCRRAAAG